MFTYSTPPCFISPNPLNSFIQPFNVKLTEQEIAYLYSCFEQKEYTNISDYLIIGNKHNLSKIGHFLLGCFNSKPFCYNTKFIYESGKVKKENLNDSQLFLIYHKAHQEIDSFLKIQNLFKKRYQMKTDENKYLTVMLSEEKPDRLLKLKYVKEKVEILLIKDTFEIEKIH